ncbi:oligopeptide transport system substrate-binding protein [Mobilisporobacter senegalensis]|uniref:Oligopeptide transport system substrate-binding protein n=1 Tax=Mobilisporobacter senegalensis TaxID=1329262 RepID=A0A3N1XI36_9FIRM|nr:peptide ABC transporter substrate-binding protein [Mobilisporobacter senegalensis]ROR26396.1 oligopeptide transport system substrate-binding protein [Mobilisporobacter senegalensis]
MKKTNVTKRLAVLMLLVMVITTALTACGGKKEEGASGDKLELNVHVGPEPNTIDPALNTAVDGGTLINHAFEGLMKLNDKGEVVNGQAADVKISDDQLVYTFTLRDDAKWSDGEAVKASDFEYAWRRAVDPATASEYNYMLGPVLNAYEVMAGEKDPSELGVKAVDEKTFEVTLATPTTYFLEIAAFPTTYPVREDIVSANPDTWATEPETYIGNGPYVLDTWEHQAKMVFVKNENYYDVSKLGPDAINFVLMDDQNTILTAFKNNEIVFGDDLPSENIEAMTDNGLYIEGQLGTYFLCLNVEKEEFKDVKVRQALALALDRNYIVESVAKGGQQPADTFVATGLSDTDIEKEFHDTAEPWYDVNDYEGNVAKAKQLLAEAGYADGKGFPTIELMANPGHENIMEAVQNMWAENLGLNVTISSQDWNVFIDTRKEGNYQVARHGWLADYNDPISFLDMWVTGGGNNDAQWSNAEYDALIKTVQTSTDREVRYQAMHDAEKILGEEMPIIPIYYYTDLYLKSDKLEGFYTSPLGFKFFMYSSLAE